MSICLRYTANREDSLELTNMAFLKVFSNLDAYDVERQFQPWLRRIVVNTSLDHIKSKNAGKPHFTELNQTNEFDGQDLEEPFTTEMKMDLQALEELLFKMPEPTRTFFNLYVMDEFSHAEVAEQLNCTTRTSKRYVAKAREWVVKRISKEYKEVLK